MGTVKKVSVSLSAELDAMMAEAVQAGTYNSASEVVREALRDWQHKQEMRALALENMRRAYVDGKESGTPKAVSAASMLRDLKAEARPRG
ncbi:type II toxin-antitoxin system ParD family antitoxin [Tritonibacter scottomollicae]|uniref:Antitoxin ParD1/3/4 n=1 Tax=Tritonibacter scottomollicae TaxID=483013 RepID=A0A2T0ZYS8_TRISK|nr:type II toxin-antitoxin system ParD family antitoxin [Tritonibacter scottomollicae]PRZ41444.1 antitoxin ParD1/3/4 [Tritonibacter scottomollicae]